MNLTNHAIENCSVTGQAEPVFNVLVLEMSFSATPKFILHFKDKA